MQTPFKIRFGNTLTNKNDTFCIFSAHYLPHVGGVEKYTQNLARQLADQGNRVIIVTSNVYDLAEREDLGEGVDELASHGQVSRSVVDDDRANALGLR